jgi:hypothetical protein
MDNSEFKKLVGKFLSFKATIKSEWSSSGS